MKYIFIIYIAITVTFISGCNSTTSEESTGENGVEDVNRGVSTVEVYKYDESVQCYGGGITLETMKCELTDNDIAVLSSYCDVDGYIYPAACNIRSGNINVYEIYEDDLDSTITLGFNSMDELSDPLYSE